MIGQVQTLDVQRAANHWKQGGLDFSELFHKPDVPHALYNDGSQTLAEELEEVLDMELLQQAAPAGRERDGHKDSATQGEPYAEQPIQVRLEGPLRQRKKGEHVFSSCEDGGEAIYVTVIPPLTLAHGLEAVVDRIDLCGERVASMAYGRSSRRHFEVAGSETHLVDPARPHWNRANVRVEPS